MKSHFYYYSIKELMVTVSVAGGRRHTKPFPTYTQNFICFKQNGK